LKNSLHLLQNFNSRNSCDEAGGLLDEVAEGWRMVLLVGGIAAAVAGVAVVRCSTLTSSGVVKTAVFIVVLFRVSDKIIDRRRMNESRG
jgi:hypothetical protein